MGMMPLRAVSAGRRVPLGHFDGQLHSAFTPAANLRIDNLLITLLAAGQPDQPRGVRIETPPGFDFERWLRPGMSAACRAGVIRFSGSPLQVDCHGVQLWQRDLASLSLDLPRDAAAAAWQTAAGALQAHQTAAAGISGALFADLPATPLAEAARGPVRALIAAAHRMDAPHAAEAASRLVGLGPGLTPSGDDFLAGFTAGLWISAAGPPSVDFRSAFCETLVSLAARTTAISQGFLLDAARGQASEWVIDLAEALAGHVGHSHVHRAVQTVLSQGSTSGADTVAGLLAALSVLPGIDWILRGNHDHTPAYHPESLP